MIGGYAGEVFAQRQVGTVTLHNGLVKVRRSGQERIYQRPGSVIPVQPFDVIQTGPNTRATVSLRARDETIQMFSNSHLRIETFTQSRSAFGMAVGKALFSKLRRMVGQQSFKVRTSTATIGVKGTEFILGADKENSFVLTLSGVVGVVNQAFPDREVKVHEDEVFATSKASLGPPPKVADAQEIYRIKQDDSLDSFKQITGQGLFELSTPDEKAFGDQ